MVEELGVPDGARCISQLEGIPVFLEQDQILGLENSGLKFHAVLQQPCALFTLHWFGYYSTM